LVLNRQGWDVIPEKEKMEKMSFTKATTDIGLDLHVQNFLKCLQDKTPEKLNANIEVGRKVAMVSQMGNIAYRVGNRIYWDDAKQQFDSKAANKLIHPNYNNGYKVPKY
jgi:hypothetical protein